MRQTIAIVGANLAGGHAARTLRAEGFDGEIQLIGSEPHPPYERPVLSKEVLLRQCEPERAYLQSTDVWSQQDITLRLGTTVERIRPTERELELSGGGAIRADKVLLCTGGRVRRLDIPGSDLEGVEYLRTIEDSIAIRERLRPGAPVVVIGGGFIGAEVAACARESGCVVGLLEHGDVPLSRVLGREIGLALTRIHREEGVTVATKTSVARIEGNRSVTHVVTTEGDRIEATLVVIGVGIDPAVELAAQASLDVDNGIIVDEFCQTSNPGIYAAGDVANHPNGILGERVRLEQWQNANNQGAAAARSMLGRREKFCEVPWFWSDQFDVSVQMVGRPSAEDAIVYRGDPESRSFSAFFVRNGALRGAVGVNRPRDVKRTTAYIASGQTVDSAKLADETVDLRTIGL